MIAVRADANPEIGSGHIMRCLSVAKELRRNGLETVFITSDRNGERLIKDNRFSMICLNTDWRNLSQEEKLLGRLLEENQVTHLIVDSYYITEDYLKKAGKFTKVIYLDDINKFIYPVDILINYNIYADKLIHKESYRSTAVKLMLGCSYVPLRDEFRGRSIICNNKVENILITTGGSDPYNVTGSLIEYFKDNRQYTDMTFHVIVGSLNPNVNQLRILAEEYENLMIYEGVARMSDMMLQCDIAISAGGATLYELCACGVPAISFSFADNQLSGVREFHDRKLIYYAGDIRDDRNTCMSNIGHRMKELIADSALRKGISERTSSIVDGFGALRIADEIMR